MCEIVCVKKIIRHSLGLLQSSFLSRTGGGGSCYCHFVWRAQGRVLNDSQKTESFTSASAIQPGALVGEFFLCVFIEVCTELAQKL